MVVRVVIEEASIDVEDEEQLGNATLTFDQVFGQYLVSLVVVQILYFHFEPEVLWKVGSLNQKVPLP